MGWWYSTLNHLAQEQRLLRANLQRLEPVDALLARCLTHVRCMKLLLELERGYEAGAEGLEGLT